MMPYRYIELAYGIRFEAGMRITFDEYDDAPGTVLVDDGDPQYVRVRFDDGREGVCHPASLKITIHETQAE